MSQTRVFAQPAAGWWSPGRSPMGFAVSVLCPRPVCPSGQVLSDSAHVPHLCLSPRGPSGPSPTGCGLCLPFPVHKALPARSLPPPLLLFLAPFPPSTSSHLLRGRDAPCHRHAPSPPSSPERSLKVSEFSLLFALLLPAPSPEPPPSQASVQAMPTWCALTLCLCPLKGCRLPLSGSPRSSL